MVRSLLMRRSAERFLARVPAWVWRLHLAMALAGVWGLNGCSSSTQLQWNGLVVVPDTIRAARLSACGSVRNTTPNVDRLAREGAVFAQADTAAPRTWQSYVEADKEQLRVLGYM